MPCASQLLCYEPGEISVCRRQNYFYHPQCPAQDLQHSCLHLVAEGMESWMCLSLGKYLFCTCEILLLTTPFF